MRFYINYFLLLNRFTKQIIMILIDLVLLPLSLILSYSLQQSSYIPLELIAVNHWLFYVIPIILVPIFIINGLYRSVLKYMGYHIIIAVMRSLTLGCIFIVLFINFFKLSTFFSTIVIFWFVSNLVIVGSRYLLKFFVYNSTSNKKNIAIYGMGRTGIEIIDNLKGSSKYELVALFDDYKKNGDL